MTQSSHFSFRIHGETFGEIKIPAAFMTSVRLDIARAIHYNYPDQKFLGTIDSEAI